MWDLVIHFLYVFIFINNLRFDIVEISNKELEGWEGEN